MPSGSWVASSKTDSFAKLKKKKEKKREREKGRKRERKKKKRKHAISLPGNTIIRPDMFQTSVPPSENPPS